MGDGELFLVQIWASPRFRASVRAVGDEHALLFEEPEQVSAFFRTRVEPSGETAEPRQSLAGKDTA